MNVCSEKEVTGVVGAEGLHLIGDLYQCQTGAELMVDSDQLRTASIELCKAAGLQVVGDTFYQFGGAGVTGCVLLAESHVAIHTWPEHGSVTVDVYVCNYNMDNSAKAQQVFDNIIKLFSPADARTQGVQRGEV